jgi:hypothetical protein
MNKKFLFYVFIVLFNNYLFSEIVGGSFLKIGVGARASGMSAFTAISDDVTAIHYNPAGLSQLNKKEFSFMYSEWVFDTKLGFLGFALPLKSGSKTLGCSIFYLSNDDLEGRDDDGRKTNMFNAKDFALAASYSCFFPKINYGINLKFIKQQIETKEANGFAVDLGFLYHLSNHFSFGVTIQNLAPQMKFISEYYFLPLTITAGFGYKASKLKIAFDLKNYVYEDKTKLSFGLEYLPIKVISLRLGYSGEVSEGSISNKGIVNSSDDLVSKLLGFSCGFGLNLFNKFCFDYSFVPYGSLGDTHRISLSTKF